MPASQNVGTAHGNFPTSDKSNGFLGVNISQEQKNGKKAEDGELYIKSINVDCAPMLKRLRPAPQGRGYRILKRSNHVTIYLDTINQKDA